MAFSKEFKIGFVITAVGLTLLAMAPTQRKRAPLVGSRYQLVFHELHGLQEGDQVVVGGVDAGRVVDIDFADEDKWKELNPPGDDRPVVLVGVSIRPGLPLREGTGYKVITTLRGSHFINILPPPPGDSVTQDTILNGELPAETADQLQMTLANFKDLSRSTKKIRDQFADPVFRRDMKDLASNMRFYSVEFNRISKGSRAQVARMSSALEQYEQVAMGNIRRMDAMVNGMSDLSHQMVPAVKARIAMANAQIGSAQQQMDSVYANSKKYLDAFQTYSNTMYSRVKSLDAEKIAEKIDQIKDKVENYADLATDIHQITSDPQVKQDIKALPKRLLQKSEQLKEQVHGYVEKAQILDWILPQEHKEAPEK